MQLQTQLDYITQHYATLISLHCNCNYRYNYHYTTLHQRHYTTTTPTLLDTTLHHTTVHYTTVHYATLTTPHHNCNCSYKTLITLITPHHNHNSTTLQLQLQLQLQLHLHYTTLHPAVVGEVTTATIATIPKIIIPTTFRFISYIYIYICRIIDMHLFKYISIYTP